MRELVCVPFLLHPFLCVCVMFISVFRSLSLCLVESHLLKEIRGANKWRSFRDVSTARQIMDL